MPRRFAPLKTAIWSDDDFCTLSPMGQRMYMQVLSQKRLSLCGVVPYAPRNWARGCAELTTDDIETHLGELVDRGYVYIDHDTEELWVRTMVKHDPPRGARSIAGMWNDWLEIDSPEIRQRVIHSIPDEIWLHQNAEPPESAKPLRNTPSDGASGNPEPIENEKGASSCHQPPSTSHRPPSSTRPPADVPERTDDEPTVPTKKERIINTVVDIRAAGHPKGPKWRETVAQDVAMRHGSKIEQWIEQFPGAPIDLIASALESGDSRGLAYYTPTSTPEPEPERRLTAEERAKAMADAGAPSKFIHGTTKEQA